MTKYSMQTIYETDPLNEFFSAIKNAQTKRGYEKDLGKFFDFLGLQGTSMDGQAREFARKAKPDPQWATAQISSYVQSQKERVEKGEIADSRIANLYKPIRLFCEENDITLNWKKLSRRVPKGKRAANDRAPKLEEIKTILTYNDRRIKPAVLIMVSSGARIGSFDYLNWGQITRIEKDGTLVAGKITIYAGTNEEYFSFLSPEAYRSVEEYMNYRKDQGEKISEKSPVIRDLIVGDRWGKARPGQVSRLKSTGVKRLIEDALRVTHVRGKLEDGQKRHAFQADHGFRKFFNTTLDRHMRTLFVEYLMGHTLGIKASYNRFQESDLLEEYLKAIPDLTMLEPKPTVIDAGAMQEYQTILEKLVSKYEEQEMSSDRLVTGLKKQVEIMNKWLRHSLEAPLTKKQRKEYLVMMDKADKEVEDEKSMESAHERGVARVVHP